VRTLTQAVVETETKYLRVLLTQAEGDVITAARTAAMSPTTIYRKLSDLDIAIPNRSKRKRHTKLHRKSIHIQTLLPFFGVPCDLPRHGANFWTRYAGSLDAMFFDARKNYMAMVRKYHEAGSSPDGERLAHVNALWQQLEKAMRKHGVEC
jgi:hypothetical protein